LEELSEHDAPGFFNHGYYTVATNSLGCVLRGITEHAMHFGTEEKCLEAAFGESGDKHA